MANLRIPKTDIISAATTQSSTPTIKPRFESIPSDYKFIAPTAPRESTDYIPSSPTARFANLSQFLGGGQYTQDSIQPNLLEKSKARYTSELNKALAGGALKRKTVEIDHTIPLWLGGTDTPDNKIALPLAEHDIKTKQNAVIQALYYAGKIDLPEARTLAINWQDKEITGIKPNVQGKVSLAVAEKKYKEWQKPTEVSMSDVLKTWGKKLGSAITFGKYKGEPSKTDIGEQLYAKSLQEGSRGVPGQFAQGVASGATLGWAPATGTEGEPLKETIARGTGQLAGTLLSFSWLAKLAGLAGKAVFRAKAIPTATKTSLLTKPLFGTGKTASNLPAWIEKLNRTTATFKPLGISVPKNVPSRAILGAGLFTLHGQLSKQEQNDFSGRLKRFLSDAAFGGMLAIPGQTAKGYAGLAAGTYALSAIEGATPGEAMLNSAILVGLHGFGSIGYNTKIQKLATDAAIKERAKWGIKSPKPGEKMTAERISDENMSVIETVYRESENSADFKKNMEALVISGRQIYKSDLGKEMSFAEDLKDARSLVQRTNKMTEAEIDRVPSDVPDLFNMSERPTSLRDNISTMDAPFEKELFTSTGISSDVNSFVNKNILNFVTAGGKEGDKVIIRLVTDPKEIEVYRKISKSQKTPERQFNPENVIEVFGEKDGTYYNLGKVPTERRLTDMTIAPRQVLIGDEMVDMPMGIIPSRRTWGLGEERIPRAEMNTDNLAQAMKDRGASFVTGKLSKMAEGMDVNGKPVFSTLSGQPFLDFEITKNDWLGTADINKNLNKKVSDKMSETIINRPQSVEKDILVEEVINPEQGTILNTITQKYPEPGNDAFAIFPDIFRKRLAPKNSESLKIGLKEDYGVDISIEKAKAAVDRAEKLTVEDYLNFLSENRSQPKVQAILNNIFADESFYMSLSDAGRADINKLKLLAPGPKPEINIGENIPMKPLEELQRENTLAPIQVAREKAGMQTTIPVAEKPAKYTALAEQTTGGKEIIQPVSVEKTPVAETQPQKTTDRIPKNIIVAGKSMTETELRAKFKEVKASGDKKKINEFANLISKIEKAPSITVRTINKALNDKKSVGKLNTKEAVLDSVGKEIRIIARDIISEPIFPATKSGKLSLENVVNDMLRRLDRISIEPPKTNKDINIYPNEISKLKDDIIEELKPEILRNFTEGLSWSYGEKPGSTKDFDRLRQLLKIPERISDEIFSANTRLLNEKIKLKASDTTIRKLIYEHSLENPEPIDWTLKNKIEKYQKEFFGNIFAKTGTREGTAGIQKNAIDFSKKLEKNITTKDKDSYSYGNSLLWQKTLEYLFDKDWATGKQSYKLGSAFNKYWKRQGKIKLTAEGYPEKQSKEAVGKLYEKVIIGGKSWDNLTLAEKKEIFGAQAEKSKRESEERRNVGEKVFSEQLDTTNFIGDDFIHNISHFDTKSWGLLADSMGLPINARVGANDGRMQIIDFLSSLKEAGLKFDYIPKEFFDKIVYGFPAPKLPTK